MSIFVYTNYLFVICLYFGLTYYIDDSVIDVINKHGRPAQLWSGVHERCTHYYNVVTILKTSIIHIYIFIKYNLLFGLISRYRVKPVW